MQKSIRVFAVAALSAAALFLAGCETPPKPKPAPRVAQPAPVIENSHQSLSADALFAFGKADLQSLNEKGRGDLDALVAKLHSVRQVNAVQLIGYTDRIGGAEYNQKLSQQRAEAVRDYLVQHGINGSVIHAEGRGEADPVAECPKLKSKKLKDCLAPNRRVEVNITTVN
jgi:OmpA-OmpF porin, OOP family